MPYSAEDLVPETAIPKFLISFMRLVWLHIRDFLSPYPGQEVFGKSSGAVSDGSFLFQAGGKAIHVHRAVIGCACSALGGLWRPGSEWVDGKGAVSLGETTYTAAW